jgi:hypothetical protein
MKIIFLDIDGVIASDDCFNTNSFMIGKIKMPYKWDKRCVESLKNILEKTGANIVLTSDWRKFHDLLEMREIFNYYKLPKDKLIGFTYNLRKWNDHQFEDIRSKEIDKYLSESEHTIEKWVAVDDMNLEKTTNFVRVLDTWIGITSVEQEIITKLNV